MRSIAQGFLRCRRHLVIVLFVVILIERQHIEQQRINDYGSEMDWTGASCCIAGSNRQCVDGTSSSCYGSQMDWTGAKCCLDQPAQCVPGTSSSCYGSNKYWTGSVCCLL